MPMREEGAQRDFAGSLRLTVTFGVSRGFTLAGGQCGIDVSRGPLDIAMSRGYIAIVAGKCTSPCISKLVAHFPVSRGILRAALCTSGFLLLGPLNNTVQYR